MSKSGIKKGGTLLNEQEQEIGKQWTQIYFSVGHTRFYFEKSGRVGNQNAVFGYCSHAPMFRGAPSPLFFPPPPSPLAVTLVDTGAEDNLSSPSLGGEHNGGRRRKWGIYARREVRRRRRTEFTSFAETAATGRAITPFPPSPLALFFVCGKHGEEEPIRIVIYGRLVVVRGAGAEATKGFFQLPYIPSWGPKGKP